MKLIIKKEVEARFLKLEVAVRYDDEDMPFDAPKREGNFWRATIDLETKKIIDWPIGKTLSFEDMKICDEGTYTLFDKDSHSLSEINGYVPNSLLPGDFGDYLSLDIDQNGKITNWLSDANLSDFQREEERKQE